jgi:transcription initiation factor TFIID subunit 8
MEHFVEDLKKTSTSARRDHPIPTDFDSTLKLYNTTTSSLRPHTQRILNPKLLAPLSYEVDTTDKDFQRPLPTLGPELSGDIEKKAKEYVPQRFPSFPSKHTFISTLPEEDPTRRDAKKTREAATQAAKQAEDALRGLFRAAKIPQQKEIRKQVERHAASRERHSVWEKLMAQKMREDGLHLDEANDEEFQTGIANYSMIVNWAGDTLRMQAPKGVRRGPKANHDRAARQGAS